MTLGQQISEFAYQRNHGFADWQIELGNTVEVSLIRVFQILSELRISKTTKSVVSLIRKFADLLSSTVILKSIGIF